MLHDANKEAAMPANSLLLVSWDWHAEVINLGQRKPPDISAAAAD
jgi:hypothetical protein